MFKRSFQQAPRSSRRGAALVDLELLRGAVQKGQDVLRRTQLPNGAWRSPDDMGPACVAQVAVTLRFLGVLTPEESADILGQLTAQQRSDGSFVAYPFAPQGELCATAMALAGLHAVGLGEDDDRVRRARSFYEKHGGADGVIAAMKQGDMSAIALSMLRLLDPERLPEPPMFVGLFPALERFLERRFNVGLVMGILQTGVLVRFLRGAWGPRGDRKSFLDSFLDSIEYRRCLELLDTFQNEGGDWNGNTPQTSMALATLQAMGLPPGDPRMIRGVAWLRRQLGRASEGVRFSAFGSGVWTCALSLRAMLQSGMSRRDPAVIKAVEWLLDAQITRPQSELSNPHDAPRIGGWGFQRSNHTMPDPDDTGVVLGALGLALDASEVVVDMSKPEPDVLPEALADRARAAVEKAAQWLFGMHNPNGGFAAFEYGLPGQKTRTPIMTHPIALPSTLGEAIDFVLNPPVELGDPSTADVTARVIYGLCQVGCSPRSSEVERSIAFLKRLQLDEGQWWGRWMVNYLPATACVLMALGAAGADMKAPWIKKAIRWVMDHQNADGGWGEDPVTYREPGLAGKGPSMPPLTGLVLTALLDAGEGQSEAVARGIRYLLAEQRADGTWPNGDWLHVFVNPNYRPNSFYYLPTTPRYYPLEALGRYLADRVGVAKAPRAGVTAASAARADSIGDKAPDSVPARHADGSWNDAYFDRMRQVGDPEADDVVREIFQGEEVKLVNKLVGQILAAQDQVPAGLPPKVADYYTRTAVLPSWADPAQIAIAQRLFTRCGWFTAAALFCSALPQAYCAAKGARVLHATQRIEAQVQRRVMETAQFIFDVMDEGALDPAGRGIRAAQKVRLLHGANRYLLRREARWDEKAWGVPINQEDLAGTLLTFSCIVLDAFKRFDEEVSAEEAEAWLHTWKIVGHLLGIHPSVMPRDVRDGDALMDVIRRRQWAPSAEGQALAKALVDSMTHFAAVAGVPGLPAGLIRYLAGDHCADILGLPRADWTHHLLEAGAFLKLEFGHANRPAGIAAILDRVSHALMRGVVEIQRPNSAVKFRIPAALTEAWNLQPATPPRSQRADLLSALTLP